MSVNDFNRKKKDVDIKTFLPNVLKLSGRTGWSVTCEELWPIFFCLFITTNELTGFLENSFEPVNKNR